MRYVFFGSPEFSAIILEKLIKTDFIPEAVVCNPDRPVGRKKVITPPPTKMFVAGKKTLSVSVLQPEKLDKDFMLQVLSFKPDVFIVAAYAKIIPQEILDIPKFGTIGVHPSLLPKYRGASPIQSAILNGDEKTGTTLYLMDEKVDHGAILAASNLPLATSDNYETLSQKLTELSADLLIETLPKFVRGEINPLSQDESQATFTKKFTTEDGFVDPDDLRQAQDGASMEKAILIDRKVRSLNPEPGTWTIWQGGKPFDSAQGKRMKILDTTTCRSMLTLKKIQFEGKNPVEL